MRLFRLAALAAVPLALATLVSLTAPASAALTDNALATTGSALPALGGVRVEAVALPDTAR